jgi:hypothetical protein
MDGSITCKSFASLLTTIHLLRNAPTHSMLSVTVLNPNVSFGCSRIQAYWVLCTLRLTVRRNLRWFLFLTSDGQLYRTSLFTSLFTVESRQQLTRPGQARLTQGHTNPLGLIAGGHFIFICQIANVVCGEIGAWVGTLSHWVPDAAPLLTIPHRNLRCHFWLTPYVHNTDPTTYLGTT